MSSLKNVFFPFTTTAAKHTCSLPCYYEAKLSYDDLLSTTITDLQDIHNVQPTTSAISCEEDIPAMEEDKLVREIKRSTRTVNKPKWMHDFVTAAIQSFHPKKVHYSAANQVIYTHLNPQF